MQFFAPASGPSSTHNHRSKNDERHEAHSNPHGAGTQFPGDGGAPARRDIHRAEFNRRASFHFFTHFKTSHLLKLIRPFQHGAGPHSPAPDLKPPLSVVLRRGVFRPANRRGIFNCQSTAAFLLHYYYTSFLDKIKTRNNKYR